MKQITDLYANQYRAGLCTTRLMGLTATLLNSDVKGKMLRKSDLFAQVDALERAFCGRVISSDTDEVLRSSTNPTEEFQIYPETEPHAIIQRLLAEVEPYFDMFKPDVMASLLNAIQPQEGSMPKRMEGGDIAFPIIKKPSVMKDLKQMYDEVQVINFFTFLYNKYSQFYFTFSTRTISPHENPSIFPDKANKTSTPPRIEPENSGEAISLYFHH
ncbi:uncharacterized protein LOC113471403 [Diaphorina citri]|uniref:Uncharacterized protein LOC113471403 n=1 Tax=Diaphorina citri TaxID=121845 RepID=A0A3Q0JHX6_DIACI|nr:uncharacterized protein LOC113471403 [Diaphorina citri]